MKMPLLVALTLACNGLLNGLLGLLLGTGLGFRQSLLALLTAFALAAVILGSLAPVTFFLAWNAPPPDAPGARKRPCRLPRRAHGAHRIRRHHGEHPPPPPARGEGSDPAAATATLLAWLGGNGFLGAQFSWILRPFFGSPSLKVAVPAARSDGREFLSDRVALHRPHQRRLRAARALRRPALPRHPDSPRHPNQPPETMNYPNTSLTPLSRHHSKLRCRRNSI